MCFLDPLIHTFPPQSDYTTVLLGISWLANPILLVGPRNLGPLLIEPDCEAALDRLTREWRSAPSRYDSRGPDWASQSRLDERVFKEQWNTVRHCEEIVKRLLRFPWQQAGIAVALDERDCKEQWNTVRHCEEIVRRLLSRRPGNVLDREAYGAKVLAIVAALIPINLSEGIDLDTLHDVLSAAMSQEKTGVDDFDDVAVAAEQLHGAGELQGIEYRFGNTANLARKAGHKSSLDL